MDILSVPFLMSNATGTEEAITIERDGIAVKKSLLTGEFPVPTIAFELSTDLEEPTIIRVTETIPKKYSMDAIGFHSDYESDHWTAYEDNRIEFERMVSPDETIVTIYGIRSEDATDLDAFMADPEVVIVDPIEGPDTSGEGKRVESMVSHEGGDMIGEMVGSMDGEPAGGDADVESVYEHEDRGRSIGSAGAEVDGHLLAEQLAHALSEGQVSADDRRIIREELGLDLSAATEAQLRHLQTRVEDAIAYANPVEEFLNAGGIGRIEELEEDVTATRQELHNRRDEFDELDERISQVKESIPDVDDRMDDLEAKVDSFSTSIDELRDGLDSTKQEAKSAKSVSNKVEDDLDEMLDKVDRLSSTLDNLDRDLEEMQTWRDQLGELFGGQAE